MWGPAGQITSKPTRSVLSLRCKVWIRKKKQNNYRGQNGHPETELIDCYLLKNPKRIEIIFPIPFVRKNVFQFSGFLKQVVENAGHKHPQTGLPARSTRVRQSASFSSLSLAAHAPIPHRALFSFRWLQQTRSPLFLLRAHGGSTSSPSLLLAAVWEGAVNLRRLHRRCRPPPGVQGQGLMGGFLA